MFRLIKEVLILLLSFSRSIVVIGNEFNLTTFNCLNNQPCMTSPALIDLNPDDNNQGFYYYPFMVNSDRCNGSCNILDDISGRVNVPKKQKM